MATEFEDIGKNLDRVFNNLEKQLPRISDLALKAGLAEFLGRVFSDASADVRGQLLGFYKSEFYAAQTRKRGRTINLQLTDQLKQSIAVGVDAKGRPAVGYLVNKNSRRDKTITTNTGSKTIKANNLKNSELADFINERYGTTLEFSESEIQIVEDTYLRLFSQAFDKEFDKVF